MVISSKLKLILIAIIVPLVAGCSDGAYRSFETVSYDHWGVQGRFKTRDFVFQNVTQSDLVTLLSGKTFVGYQESDGLGRGYGALTVEFYDPSGELAYCIVSYKTGKPVRGDAFAMKRWISTTANNQNIGYQLAEMEVIELAGHSSYGIVQYDGSLGRIANIGYESPFMRDISKGHLQNGIPAAVYTACPEFPSAESLGTFVNHNQTSWNYFELVEQDAGDRVIRPDLVTEFTPVPLNPAVAVAQ
ncbi:hypothetical protein [Yoonia vestfoldensis]|uniref:Lipoprotein n=1 Tax=Yoonia vestfoldensis TaxID=245188 RepID=A0A1Y0EIJ6_9RHOB|nr:hypothetical protein [Yoonia vestfoldensis]ARU03122.1 hypothetical protein LOKVESSMR4R_03857 [Yoonia vestfoldensis]